MPMYTADAVSLLVYLIDALPDAADQVFADAEAGTTDIQAPGTALAETLYSVSRDKDGGGSPSSGRQRRLVKRWSGMARFRSHLWMAGSWSSTVRW